MRLRTFLDFRCIVYREDINTHIYMQTAARGEVSFYGIPSLLKMNAQNQPKP